MQNFFYIIIFVFGLIFGSFASVLITRWKSGKSGITNGRSECPSCNHTLGFFDLFPVFSYVFLGGKCRYCKTKISPIYPALEFFMGLVFVASSYFLIDFNNLFIFSTFEIFKLIFFLFVSFSIVVFVFYDLLYTEIPDEIMVPAIFILVFLIFLSYFNNDFAFLFEHYSLFDSDFWNNILINGLTGTLIIYSFFYLQIFIPGSVFTLKEKKYRVFGELIAYYFLFPLIIFIDYFKNILTKKHSKEEIEKELEEDIEIPSWIGWGDLRIAIFAGLIAGTKKALLGLILAYIIGSIFGIFILSKKYFGKKEIDSIIPFGPFLGIGLLISLYGYQNIIDLYFHILGL